MLPARGIRHSFAAFDSARPEEGLAQAADASFDPSAVKYERQWHE